MCCSLLLPSSTPGEHRQCSLSSESLEAAFQCQPCPQQRRTAQYATRMMHILLSRQDLLLGAPLKPPEPHFWMDRSEGARGPCPPQPGCDAVHQVSCLLVCRGCLCAARCFPFYMDEGCSSCSHTSAYTLLSSGGAVFISSSLCFPSFGLPQSILISLHLHPWSSKK